ncbi:MAG: hypothetical protein LBD68_10655 [Zoogloeaceae bacterium]|jgi:hypothetical protein|nr:hypothetical protein [Zoogloeaceae bacterium]
MDAKKRGFPPASLRRFTQRLFFLCALTLCGVLPAHAAAAEMPYFANKIILAAPGADAERQVHDAIVAAAESQGWKVASDTPRSLRLRLIVRNQYAVVVNILINIDMVDVEYVSSINMSYGKDANGNEVISPAYGKWIDRLLNAARQHAAQMSPATGRAASAESGEPVTPPQPEPPDSSAPPDMPDAALR